MGDPILIDIIRQRIANSEPCFIYEDEALMLIARIEQLEAALREIAAASKIIAKGEDMETALKVMLASYQNIARKALEGGK